MRPPLPGRNRSRGRRRRRLSFTASDASHRTRAVGRAAIDRLRAMPLIPHPRERPANRPRRLRPSLGWRARNRPLGAGCSRTAFDWPRRPAPQIEVVQLFAVLHDCRRRNEGDDPNHGPRAAKLARSLRGEVFELSDREFRMLHRACAGHTHERTHPDETIQTCWDADRLDLGRVGITPNPYFLSTDAAKRPETIRWADGRATMGVIPELVKTGVANRSGRQ